MPLIKQPIIFLLFLLTTSFSIAQQHPDITTSYLTDSAKVEYPHPNQISLTDSIINFGKQFLRKPYHYRPNKLIRFDCSGFTSYVFGNFGYQLKRSSAEQAKQFDTIEPSQLKTGDLVFYAGRGKGTRVGHVGIVVSTKENGKFDFIHSSVQSGIVISDSDENYYASRFIKAGRVINYDSLLRIDIPMEAEFQLKNTYINETGENAINTTSTNPEIIVPNPTIIHVVKSGDTLYAISRKFGISISELKKINHLKSNKIKPKQQLIIADKTPIANTNLVQ